MWVESSGENSRDKTKPGCQVKFSGRILTLNIVMIVMVVMVVMLVMVIGRKYLMEW